MGCLFRSSICYIIYSLLYHCDNNQFNIMLRDFIASRINRNYSALNNLVFIGETSVLMGSV